MFLSFYAPSFKALVGIELLLDKAQVWEENAAKHVSIAGGGLRQFFDFSLFLAA